ncbi:CAP-Gly domain-containing linker protein 1-like isoform X2 [Stegodyphus dumicola]|uniref:CAP-Gly domain-containing linker protein 1-like isoform X2 n=1 Tax=Stegodyphus dumicola TaxID=202533 RepID=UPI0015AAAC70|nr:CAP-Gly domain-containing linker protein 1-like isoform X2 [Stegodyphus dumicola]
MQTQFAQHKQELQQKLDVSEAELQAAHELKNELDVQHSVLEELQQNLQESEDKCKILEKQVQDMPAIMSEKTELQNKEKELKKIIEEKTKIITDIESKNLELKRVLTANQDLLHQKENECEAYKAETIKTDQQSIESLKLSQVESENLSLKSKIIELEALLQKKTAVTDNSKDITEDQEKESLYSQIDFLNSIIVDMRQKNEDLAKELELQKTCWDENDFNFKI